MYLRCVQARVILGVTPGTTSPREIGRESIRWCGRRTLARSEKPQGNIPRRVTPRWHVIQPERIFIQLVTWETWDVFAGLEKMLQETFLPRLFFRKTKSLSPIVGALSAMPVKKSGLGLMNSVASAKKKYPSSQQVSAELIWAVTGGGAYSNADHLLVLGEERRDIQKKNGMTQTAPHSRV